MCVERIALCGVVAPIKRTSGRQKNAPLELAMLFIDQLIMVISCHGVLL